MSAVKKSKKYAASFSFQCFASPNVSFNALPSRVWQFLSGGIAHEVREINTVWKCLTTLGNIPNTMIFMQIISWQSGSSSIIQVGRRLLIFVSWVRYLNDKSIVDGWQIVFPCAHLRCSSSTARRWREWKRRNRDGRTIYRTHSMLLHERFAFYIFTMCSNVLQFFWPFLPLSSLSYLSLSHFHLSRCFQMKVGN